MYFFKVFYLKTKQNGRHFKVIKVTVGHIDEKLESDLHFVCFCSETPPRNSEIEAHHRAQKSATLPRTNSTSAIQRYTTPFSGSRRMFDKGPSVVSVVVLYVSHPG